MPTIVETRDWRRLVSEAGDDLASWYDSENPIDWPRTLAQPNWHLITDGQGSWCLLEPVSPVYAAEQHHRMEAHLIIAPTSRGRYGLTVARDMLAFIEALGVQSLMAKVTERKTTLFLRWLGFTPFVNETNSFAVFWFCKADQNGTSSSRSSENPPT